MNFDMGVACKLKKRRSQARMYFERAREIAEPLSAATLLTKIETALAELQ